MCERKKPTNTAFISVFSKRFPKRSASESLMEIFYRRLDLVSLLIYLECGWHQQGCAALHGSATEYHLTGTCTSAHKLGF